MQLWLLRHGDAERAADDDASRELTEKGRRQSVNAGRALAALGIEPEACLSSPKTRALETARLACEQLGVEPTEDERLRGGDFDPVQLASGAAPADARAVLLVGHEPDLSRAIETLTGARAALKKGGLAAIEGGILLSLLRPAEVKRLGGGTPS